MQYLYKLINWPADSPIRIEKCKWSRTFPHYESRSEALVLLWCIGSKAINNLWVEEPKLIIRLFKGIWFSGNFNQKPFSNEINSTLKLFLNNKNCYQKEYSTSIQQAYLLCKTRAGSTTYWVHWTSRYEWRHIQNYYARPVNHCNGSDQATIGPNLAKKTL